MWSNFHTHSNFCDGKGAVQDYVEQAQSEQVISLGFSSHAPLPFPNSWCMEQEKLSNYLQSVNALKKSQSKIEIYTGLEVDFIPGIISPLDFNDQLDYTIGSIHFVETMPNGVRWEIDGSHALFLQGLESIFKNNIQDSLVRYYELTREMVSTTHPTIVGHLDKIKIQNIDGKFFNEHDQWYQDQIIETLNTIAKSGSIVEVNTRGIYQKKSATTYPSPWVLELIHQKNIPITLNSDAHHPADLINQFSTTATLLRKIGFKEINILHNGNWQTCAFNDQGLILS